MKLLILPLLLLSSIICISQARKKLHPWTDSTRSYITGSFISFDGEKVTIKWDGQVVPIPLASLSPESQKSCKATLARKMSVSDPR